MKLSFRNWLEALENPEATADHWLKNLPKGPAQQNEAAINEFVDAMADPQEMGLAIAYDIENRAVYSLRYPHRPISNNLLNLEDDRLRTAEGVVTNQFDPDFGFYMGGTHAGCLIIQMPPMIFDRVDRDMLFSIIWHELGHAIDWLNPRFRKIAPAKAYKWNAEAYAKNIHEARRIADQLRVLLQKLGSAEKVLAALEGKRGYEDLSSVGDPDLAGHLGDKIGPRLYRPISPFKLHPDLIPAAKAFLQRFQQLNESFMQAMASTILGTAAALGLGGQPAMPPVIDNQPKQVQVFQVQRQEVWLAAWCVNEIMKLLQLKNFLVRS